jgi:putative ABC transport system permease protein
MLPVGFRNNIKMGLDTLRQHKLRSGLTVLGVMIGTITVIVIAAFVSGIEARVTKEIESFGTRSIYLYKFDPGFNVAPSFEERTRPAITYEDAVAIRAECPSVEYVTVFFSPIPFDQGPFVERIHVRRGETEMTNATVSSSSTDYFRMGVIHVEEGRFFTDFEDEHRAKVAVIGPDVANVLFPNENPLEKQIQINGEEYRVIGVLKRRETFLVGDEDPNNENKIVALPYHTLRQYYPYVKDHFVMATAPPGRMDAALEEIRDLMRRRRKVPFGEKDNFGVQTSDQIITQFGAITSGVFALMVAISSVGLLIGGIGVMNIMLVSVTERTKEIGVRKALGARRKDIITQFLIEAATLTGVGGLAGITIGVGLAFLIRFIMPTFIPLWAPIVGFVVSVGLGVGFGLWPAWKAARLDPIEALRYE